MRIVNINLSQLQDSYFLGYLNEHLMTTLNIQLSNDLIGGDGYSIDFKVLDKRKTATGIEAEDNVISYVLPYDITSMYGHKCQVKVQITAYLNQTVIGKSAIINGYFDEGINNTEVNPTIIPLVDEVYLNTANRHNHSNKSTIDLFSTGDDNGLMWDDEPIQAQIDLSAYARLDEVVELGDNISLLNNDAGYLTPETTTDYAMLDDIPTSLSEFDNDCGYARESDIALEYATKTELTTGLSAKANVSDIPTVPTNVSAFTNDAGYLTQHQDLSAYALKTELPVVPTNISAFTNDLNYTTKTYVDSAIVGAIEGSY